MKKLAFVLVMIVALIAVAVTQLDSIVETGIETAGPETLHVPVKVAKVKLSPLSGNVTVQGLEIGQPDGFGDGAIASIGDFDLKLDTNTLMSNHIIIDSIRINEPMFDIRMQDGKNNFTALQEGITIPSVGDTAGQADTGEEITLTIRELVVSNPRILAKSDGFMKLDEDLKLADFTLTDMGTDEKGLAPSEIARHIMDTLQPQITKALVAAGASNKIKDLAGDAKGKLEKGLGGLLKKLKKDK